MLDPKSQNISVLLPTEKNLLLPTHNSSKEILCLSEGSNELLKKLETSEADMGLDKEKIKMLNLITNANFFGRFIHTILNKSLSKTVLLSLFVSRKHIIHSNVPIPQPATQKLPANSVHSSSSASTSNQHSHSTSSSSDDSSSALILLSSSSESSEEMVSEKKKNIFSEIYEKIFYLSSPVLFQNEKALKKIAGISALHETVVFIFEGTWNVIFISLLIDGLANIAIYPEYFTNVTSKYNYILSIPANASKAINGALSRKWMYIPLMTIPLLWGVLNGKKNYSVYAAWKKTDELKNILQKYSPSMLGDLVGWLLTSVIPEWLSLISPVSFCNIAIPQMEYILCACFFSSFLPQHKIYEIFEEAKYALLWDGTLNKKQRLELFQEIFKFKEAASLLTYTYVISTLAAILREISIEQLVNEKKAGINKENLESLLEIKILAFQELHRIAHQYDSDGTSKTEIKLFLSYVYANHLMLSSGYPQHWHSYVFSPLYHGLRYTSIAVFYYTFISAILDILYCYMQGKRWSYVAPLGEFVCHLCGEFDLFIQNTHDIDNAQNCTARFLLKEHSLEKMEKFFNAISLFLNEVTSLDLSKQTKLMNNEKNLTAFFNLLKPRLKNLKVFNAADDLKEMDCPYEILNAPIAQFINESSLERFTSCGRAKDFDFFATVLPYTKIRYFEFRKAIWSQQANANLTKLFIALINSTIEELIIPWAIDCDDLNSLLKTLPYMNVTKIEFYILSGYCNNIQIYRHACELVSDIILKSRLSYLELGVASSYTPNLTDTGECAAQIAENIKSLNKKFGLSLAAPLNDVALLRFGDLLYTTTFLEILKLSDYRHDFIDRVSENSLKDFFYSIRKSHLIGLQVSIPMSEDVDKALLGHTLSDSLGYVNLEYLSVKNCYFGPEAMKYLIANTTNLLSLKSLDLSGNNMDQTTADILFSSIDKLQLKSLVIDGNIYDLSILAEKLPNSTIIELSLRLNSNIENVIIPFAKNLQKYNLLSLDFGAISGCQNKEVVDIFFKNLPGSSLRKLDMALFVINCNQTQTADIGEIVAHALMKPKFPPLWVAYIENSPKLWEAATNLTYFSLGDTHAEYYPLFLNPICHAFEYTQIDYSYWLFNTFVAMGWMPYPSYCQNIYNESETDDLSKDKNSKRTDHSLFPSTDSLKRIEFFSSQSEVFLPKNSSMIELPATISVDPALLESSDFENSNHQNNAQAYLGVAMMPGIGTMILSLIAIYLIYRALSPVVSSMWGRRGMFFHSSENINSSEQTEENNQLVSPQAQGQTRLDNARILSAGDGNLSDSDIIELPKTDYPSH